MDSRALASTMTRDELNEKLISLIQKPDTPDGCWTWKRSKTLRTYGMFYDSIKQRYTGAYRFAYELFVGIIPDELVLDHKCCVPACVNPAHLEPVTVSENLRRSYAQRRATREAKRREPKAVSSVATDVPLPPQYAWLNARPSWSVQDVVREYEAATGVPVSHDTV